MLLNVTGKTITGACNHNLYQKDLYEIKDAHRYVNSIEKLLVVMGCNGVIIPEPYAPIVCLLLQLEGTDVFQLVNNRVVAMIYLPTIAKFPEVFK